MLHPEPAAAMLTPEERRDRAIDALATLAWLVDLQHDVPAERLAPLMDILVLELHQARKG